MNDFTKEELKDILEGISWCLDGDNALWSEKLVNKIQLMIDNYCEHKNTYMDSDGGISLVCSSCGVTTMDI